jgi:cation diffusion facilitator CzcD-associated flavoprotein CzcO
VRIEQAAATRRRDDAVVNVAIVGAGFSGIGMAVRLQQLGHSYRIFERSDDVGGVWHHNTYPGAACDVPSYVYSYSWAQRRDWSQPCSPQAEIQDYLRDVAREHEVLPNISLGVEIVEAQWVDTALKWQLRTSAGDSYEADALVLACGQLSRPAWPRIDGLETFEGHAFHSAEWDHGHDLRGRRVAVIGTGASAIQFVPPVAEQVAQLDVYQRTAPYMLPRRNPRYPRAVRSVIRRVPGLQTLRRYGMWSVMEGFILGYTRLPALKALIRLWSLGFMRLQLRDAELRRKVWPDYAFGCKRILFGSAYLPALQRANVEVVCDPIARISARGIVTAGGHEREVDTIIWGTGFQADQFVVPLRVHGASGVELQETWRDGAEAHLGISVSGYPNMFLLYGPNTNLGVGSIVAMIEAQIGYVAAALRLVSERQTPAALDVRADVQRESADGVQARLADSVWTQCESWYRKDGDGRVVGNWPGQMFEYVRATRRVDPAEYDVLEPLRVSAGTAHAR